MFIAFLRPYSKSLKKKKKKKKRKEGRKDGRKEDTHTLREKGLVQKRT